VKTYNFHYNKREWKLQGFFSEITERYLLLWKQGDFSKTLSLYERENDELFSLPKRKKFKKRSWQTCGLIACACGSRIEQSPINSLKCEPTSRHTIFEPKPRRVSDVYAVLCPRAVRARAFLRCADRAASSPVGDLFQRGAGERSIFVYRPVCSMKFNRIL
jgi:hypothetical protein